VLHAPSALRPPPPPPPPPRLPYTTLFRSLLRAWNRRLLETDTPWLQVLPYDGRFAAIGPLVLPGDTACNECYRRRRFANEDDPRAQAALDASPAAYPEAPALAAALAGLAVTVALDWIATGDP